MGIQLVNKSGKWTAAEAFWRPPRHLSVCRSATRSNDAKTRRDLPLPGVNTALPVGSELSIAYHTTNGLATKLLFQGWHSIEPHKVRRVNITNSWSHSPDNKPIIRVTENEKAACINNWGWLPPWLTNRFKYRGNVSINSVRPWAVIASYISRSWTALKDGGRERAKQGLNTRFFDW